MQAIIGYQRDATDRFDGQDGESLPVRLARQIRQLPHEPDDPRYTARTMTTAQAARALGCCVWTLQQWAKRGLIQCGRDRQTAELPRHRIRRDDLLRFLEGRPRYEGAAGRIRAFGRQWLTVDDAAELLKRDRSTVTYHINAGNLAAVQGSRKIHSLSGRLMFSLKDLADFTLAEKRRAFAGRDHGSWTPVEDALVLAGAAKPRRERLPFWREHLPLRSPNSCKVRLFRLRRRKPYFVTVHAVERYWERVDPNSRGVGMGPAQQHIVNELQRAVRFIPSDRHRLTPEESARISGLAHWPHKCRTRPLVVVCRTFRAVITVPPATEGQDGWGVWPVVATVWEQTVGGAGDRSYNGD